VCAERRDLAKIGAARVLDGPEGVKVAGIDAAARRRDSHVTLRRSVRASADHRRVPRISVFYGIVIAMYYRDHAPPHFHAIYGEHEATIVIETLAILTGDLPRRALRLVREWAELHQAELEANWDAARARVPLATIEPLP
jgi:hypothetical protein